MKEKTIQSYFPVLKKQKQDKHQEDKPENKQVLKTQSIQKQQYSTDQQQCHEIGSCRYTARMSKDKVHRYQLTRTWDNEKGRVLFIMCNPSLADSTKDDPTIRKITNYAKSWGYGGIDVGNIFAFRSPYPKDLKKAIDPEGKKNKKYIDRLIKNADKVVYAWGCGKTEPGWLSELMEKYQKRPYCLDVLRSGEPCHPLKRNLHANAQLMQYR